MNGVYLSASSSRPSTNWGNGGLRLRPSHVPSPNSAGRFSIRWDGTMTLSLLEYIVSTSQSSSAVEISFFCLVQPGVYGNPCSPALVALVLNQRPCTVSLGLDSYKYLHVCCSLSPASVFESQASLVYLPLYLSSLLQCCHSLLSRSLRSLFSPSLTVLTLPFFVSLPPSPSGFTICPLTRNPQPRGNPSHSQSWEAESPSKVSFSPPLLTSLASLVLLAPSASTSPSAWATREATRSLLSSSRSSPSLSTISLALATV